MAAFNFEEYFQSKFSERLFQDPDVSEKHMTAATRLLEKKREMLELEQALSAQKEAFQMKMASLNARREELDKKELSLRGSLMKFNQFLIETDIKKQRAEKKANNERSEKDMRVQECAEKMAEREKLKAFLEKQRKVLEREKVYRSYMERVIEKSTEFQELKDILRKHDTLSSNLGDMIEKSNVMSDKLDSLKQEYYTMITKNDEATMRYTNTIADLTWRKETATSNHQKWESLWTHIQNTAARNVLLLGRVKMATENIYIQIYKQRGLPPKEAESVDEQLKKIKTYIKDLTDIIVESSKQEKLSKDIFDRLAGHAK